jgi:hypothetical protein
LPAILPQLIPYGRPLSHAWGAFVSATWVALAVAVLAAATTPGAVAMFPGVDNPFGVEALRGVNGALRTTLPALLLALVSVALASLVARYRRADGDERRQVLWFGYGLVACIVAALVAPWWVVNVAVLLVPGGIAIAALRYRLYGIDLLVNRTLVGAVLLAGAALVYAAVVGWVGALLGSRGGITPFAGAFAVALAFHPARVRVQNAVDRMLYGERGDPYALVARVDAALRDAAGPRQALHDGLEAVRCGLRLPRRRRHRASARRAGRARGRRRGPGRLAGCRAARAPW